MKIYISGKITGLPINEAKRKFDKAEELLNEKGMETVNPFNNGLRLTDNWKDHLICDIENLLHCDAIYMLNDWFESKGARIEKYIAEECGITVIFESDINKNV